MQPCFAWFASPCFSKPNYYVGRCLAVMPSDSFPFLRRFPDSRTVRRVLNSSTPKDVTT